jgi:hypothetical protein
VLTEPALVPYVGREEARRGEAVESEGQPALELTPTGGSYFFRVIVEECASLEFLFVGSLTPVQDSANELEFTKENGNLSVYGYAHRDGQGGNASR